MKPILHDIRSFKNWAEARKFLEAAPTHFLKTDEYPPDDFPESLQGRTIVLGKNRKVGFFHVPPGIGQEDLLRWCKLLANSETPKNRINTAPFFLEIANLLKRKLNLAEAADDIVKTVCSFFEADGGSILVFDPERKVLHFESMIAQKGDIPEKPAELKIPLGVGIAGWVANHREAALVEDTRLDPRFSGALGEHLPLSFGATMAAPILLGQELIGVLQLSHGRPSFFDRNDLSLLNMVAAMVAIFTEKTRIANQQRSFLKISGKERVASSVLHNIGNVLNSVNVSCTLMLSRLQSRIWEKLMLTTRLLHEHEQDLHGFFTEHPKGKLLPEFLNRLGGQLALDRDWLYHEAGKVAANIHLMRDIISTQQCISKAGLTHSHDLNLTVEEALEVQRQLLQRKKVKVEKSLRASKPVLAQKATLTHILINIVKNGVEAMDRLPARQRVLSIETGENPEGWLFVHIKDRGEGMSGDALSKLFRHGYTTKVHGHGFGLAYCAQAMAEIGGTIAASSQGPGRGATFALTIPSAAAAVAQMEPA